jgi:hypothetical protein
MVILQSKLKIICLDGLENLETMVIVYTLNSHDEQIQFPVLANGCVLMAEWRH